MSDSDPSPEPPDAAHIRVETEIAEIDAAAWDRLANPPSRPRNPFLSHAFLKALEDAGCVSVETGWLPQHIVLVDPAAARGEGDIKGVIPCYLKSHSQGEYIFDHAWADAFERAGGRYYPKLLSAVPFTPVTGPRMLVGDEGDVESARLMLTAGAVQLTEKHDVSSFHANFVTKEEWSALGGAGFLQRTDQQFHWRDDGYGDFDGFLSALASRKRKGVRKERAQALGDDLRVDWITGTDLSETHWDAFYGFYMEIGRAHV